MSNASYVRLCILLVTSAGGRLVRWSSKVDGGSTVNFGSIFVSEAFGTGVLILLGVGVVANVLLAKTKGFDGGWLLINFGWGIGVMSGVYVAYKTGGHLNPAVTIGIWTSGAHEYAPGIPVTFGNTVAYIGGQMVGAILGAAIAFLAYRQHFAAESDAGKKLGVFSTGPEIRSYGWNFLTEVAATFVLVFVIVSFGHTPTGLGPVAAALLVLGIGASLGGPTGYAINPARDLGPRIAHALLPMGAGKNSDWSYSWVPVLGPLAGGALAGLVSQFVF
ncbi:aquaporin family protein [Nocardia terpenica]|nr:aquaporin family protein [Nocardia terpenica]MBF6105919.1 aquaporin family protein [Nocardia terpenica]MBF6113497.1 aquaporin family protein [Nocardia terpenica]MBF6119660.1 aquaporin family protein [Nocardia terpenica]MBF6152071.1 aquaporin family protein [Nocardia terpenica]